MSKPAPYNNHELFADQAADYLDKHNVYEIMANLTQELIIHKPKDPLPFLIERLRNPTSRKHIIVYAYGNAADTYVSELSAQYGVVEVYVEAMLRQEIEGKSDIGNQLLKHINNNNNNKDLISSIPVDLLVPILQRRLNQEDCHSKGWVLTDFPRTEAQARAFQRSGALVSHFFLLEQAYERGVSAGSEEEDQLKAYRRAVSQISPVFKHCLSVLDGNRSKRAVWADIAEIIETPQISDAPRRPLRVCLLGNRGSGKRTQALTLSHKYGSVVVSVGDILRREREKNSVAWQAAEPFYSSGMLVPDSIIVPLFEHRLLQEDCRRNGTILDGFPRTLGQVAALQAMKTIPNRVVVLDCEEKVALERIVHRRQNIDTKEIFHDKKAPAPASMSDKLFHDPNDKIALATQINACIQEELNAVADSYKGIVLRLDSTAQTPGRLQQKIERFVLASVNNN